MVQKVNGKGKPYVCSWYPLYSKKLGANDVFSVVQNRKTTLDHFVFVCFPSQVPQTTLLQRPPIRIDVTANFRERRIRPDQIKLTPSFDLFGSSQFETSGSSQAWRSDIHELKRSFPMLSVASFQRKMLPSSECKINLSLRLVLK